jgi:hypothetical protein
VNRLACGALAITALTSCASTAPVPAPEAAPARPPPPALVPPLDSLSFYVGSWTCKGTAFAYESQPEEKWEATITVEPELDGTWLSVKMVGPGSNLTAEHKGYNPETKRWHHVGVVSGGIPFAMVSTGWNGSQMVFTDDPPGPDKGFATFTKLSDTSYSHSMTLETDKGPVKISEKFCTKR